MRDMRKNALTITVTTAVLGVFGAFLRWLQTLNAFDAETGLVTPYAGTSIVLVVYSLLAAAAMLAIVLVWLRRYIRSDTAPTALRTYTPVPKVLSWVLAVLVIAGCTVFMFSADSSESPGLQRVFSACGIIFGFCLPFLCFGRGETNVNGKVATMYASGFCCFWLVFSYKMNAQNPVVWEFAPEIIALCVAAIAYYYVCSYYFIRARVNRAMFAVMFSAYTSLLTIFDSRSLSEGVLFAANAAMMLLLEFVLVENMAEDLTKD